MTNHFKFQAPDGKQRAADALDADSVQILLKGALTDKIDDREIFMKGIDYSICTPYTVNTQRTIIR